MTVVCQHRDCTGFVSLEDGNLHGLLIRSRSRTRSPGKVGYLCGPLIQDTKKKWCSHGTTVASAQHMFNVNIRGVNPHTPHAERQKEMFYNLTAVKVQRRCTSNVLDFCFRANDICVHITQVFRRRDFERYTTEPHRKTEKEEGSNYICSEHPPGEMGNACGASSNAIISSGG